MKNINNLTFALILFPLSIVLTYLIFAFCFWDPYFITNIASWDITGRVITLIVIGLSQFIAALVYQEYKNKK